MKKSWVVIIVVFGVLILDQVLKFWVKTHMEYGEQFSILGLSWANIHFVENNGMAFGLSLGEKWGKLVLSLFRLIAIMFLIYYLLSFDISVSSSNKLLITGLYLLE